VSFLSVTGNFAPYHLTIQSSTNFINSSARFYLRRSNYFGIGKIAKDQAEDYAKRKNMRLRRWNVG
jgi:hypothetical protein